VDRPRLPLPPDLLELHVIIPDEDGEFYSHLQEDDGVSTAFLSGAYLRTTLCLTRVGNRVRVSAKVTGDGFAEFRRRHFHLVFHGCPVDRFELQGGEARVVRGRLELDNCGEGFDLSFVV